MKILTVAFMAAFFLTGCEYIQPYTDAAKENLKPLTDAIQPILDKLPPLEPPRENFKDDPTTG